MYARGIQVRTFAAREVRRTFEHAHFQHSAVGEDVFPHLKHKRIHVRGPAAHLYSAQRARTNMRRRIVARTALVVKVRSNVVSHCRREAEVAEYAEDELLAKRVLTQRLGLQSHAVGQHMHDLLQPLGNLRGNDALSCCEPLHRVADCTLNGGIHLAQQRQQLVAYLVATERGVVI